MVYVPYDDEIEVLFVFCAQSYSPRYFSLSTEQDRLLLSPFAVLLMLSTRPIDHKGQRAIANLSIIEFVLSDLNLCR